jgi:hypothetical protein
VCVPYPTDGACCCFQGYILGNYGLLYALQNSDQVERLLILNTPLATNTKLRPELAAYKNPIAFMRPAKDVSGSRFDHSASLGASTRATGGHVASGPGLKMLPRSTAPSLRFF